MKWAFSESKRGESRKEREPESPSRRNTSKSVSADEIRNSSDRTRTCDPGLMNPLLCQLSYAANCNSTPKVTDAPAPDKPKAAERVKGFEPSTSSLESLHSAIELHPQISRLLTNNYNRKSPSWTADILSVRRSKMTRLGRPQNRIARLGERIYKASTSVQTGVGGSTPAGQKFH